MKKLPARISSHALLLFVAGALSASVASPALAVLTFNVNSSTFANQYNGNQIWDGTVFQNGWTQAGYAAGSDPLPALSLNGSALRVNNAAATPANAGVNGWVQQDTGTSPWEIGVGSWTIELSGKVNEATAAPDNFVLWGTVGGSRSSITIEQNVVRYGEGGTALLTGVTNDDAYHTYRIAYDSADLTASTLGTYHVWRDNVPISGIGLPRVTADTTPRLIVGDCCGSIGGPVDPFEIQYVRYDMTGAFSPIADQGVMKLEINRNSGNMTFRNTTGAPLANIIGYSILSSGGSLIQTGWDKQSTGTNLINDDDQWTTLVAGTNVNELSEAVLSSTGADNGGDVLATTGSWDFGNVWRQSPFQDVQMELLIDDGTPEGLVLSSAGLDFQITYTGTSIPSGDFNFDGAVTTADWALFKSKYRDSNLAAIGTPLASHQAELYSAGDINIDGVYTLADYVAFEAAYDAVNGVGAFAAIPEPATATLFVICGTTFMMLRRKNFAPRRGRLLTVLAVAVAAALGAAPNASAQITPTISNAWSGVAGDRANYSAFIFKATAGTFPTSVSPLGFIDASPTFSLNSMTFTRPANDALNGTNDPQIGTNPGDLSAKTAPVFLDVYTTRTGTSDLNFTGFLGSSTNSFAWENPLNTETIAPGATFAFNFSGLTLDKNTEYWMVFSETSGDGDVANFRSRVNTAATAFGTGYLASAIQTVTPGATPTNRDWGVEYVAGLPPVPPLKLRVNTTTGAVSILDDGSALNFELNGYSITSASSLVTANWNSLQDQDVFVDPTPGNKDDGNSWEEFDNVSSAFVGEGFLTGSTTVVDNTPLQLGNIFSVGGAQNLAFTYTVATTGFPAGGLVTGVVEYFAGGQPGDFDFDTDVDGNDFLVWQRGLGTTHTADDLTTWRNNFGAGAVAAAGAVPEPSSALLAIGAAVLLASRRLRRLGVVAATVAAVGAQIAGADRASAVVFNDRHYSLGDLANVGWDTQGVNLTAFPGAIDTGAYQDLLNNGGVTTTNVGVGGLNRPGLAGAANGAVFGGSQSLTTTVSLNSPNHTWDTAALFPTFLNPPDAADDGLYDAPSAGGVSSDGDLSYTPAFPHRYTGIFSRGIQVWAHPTVPLTAARQDIVMDSVMHGIFISATGTWGLQFDSGAIDSGVTVASTLDGNGWAHVMEISGGDDLSSGGTAFGGALLVNGVAVAGGNTFYDPNTSGFSIGSNQANNGNFYTGVLDEVRVFLWGDNSDRVPADANTVRGYLGGADWGRLNLGEDNDWIKQKLASLGVTSPGDVDLNGTINAADATAFVSHWRKTFTVGGLQVGDWVSRQQGDLDYNGTVNLADAFIAHAALDAAGLALNFELLSTSVPEPSTWALLAVGVVGFRCFGRRRRSAC